VFLIFGALAECERNVIRRCTNVGLAAVRARSRKGGRPRELNAKKPDFLLQRHDSREHGSTEICDTVEVPKGNECEYVEQS
jgi:DNA invertase Pin-like site-specific DNA recombinase